MKAKICGRFPLPLILVLALALPGSGPVFPQNPGQQPPPKQEPGGKPGGQGSGGVGVDVGGLLKDVFGKHPQDKPVEWSQSLQPNQTKSSIIPVANNCDKPQRFQVASQPFPAFMRLSGDWTFEVGGHSQRSVAVQFDSSGLKAGPHEGTIVVTCVTCGGKCAQSRHVVHVVLNVAPEVTASNTGVGTKGTPTPTGPGNGAQTPTGNAVTPASGFDNPPVKTANNGQSPPPKTNDSNPPQVQTPQLPPPVRQPEGTSQTQQATASTSQPIQPKTNASNSPQPQTPQSPPQVKQPAGTPQTQQTTESKGQSVPSVTDQTLPVAPQHSLRLYLDGPPEVRKPTNLRAELTPEPQADARVKYCFAWGDGDPAICQSAPSAEHTYRSAGKYMASVEAFLDEEKLAASNQVPIEAVAPPLLTPVSWLAILLAVLVAAYGAHRARKLLRGTVTVHPHPGRHTLSPQNLNNGDALRVRCVNSAVRSQVRFLSSTERSSRA